jgi:glycerophosphoryl diester phosphodiesterase
MKTPLDLTRFSRSLLIGHRGYPARGPENTMASFRAAIEAGCDMIELDVSLSRDRRVVVIHDDTLDRTTNGKGPVKAHTLAEIKRLDAGAWFDPCFSGERVPELSEVMELTAGRCMLNIEIKTGAFEDDDPADSVERQVVRVVRDSKAMDRVIVSSFDRRILERIAAMEAPPAVAYISDHRADEGMLDQLLRLRAFSWHPRFTVLSRDQVSRVHEAGLKVFPWTINTVEEAERILAMGADGLICNEVQAVRGLLAGPQL